MSQLITPPAGAVSRNPASGELIATYPFHTPAKVERPLDDNAAAGGVWRAMSMSERVAAYCRLGAALRESAVPSRP